MKKLFLIGLLCILLIFSGCTEPPKEKKEIEPDKTSTETIQEILGKAEKITNLEYNEIQSVQGEEIQDIQGMEISSTKVYIKEEKFRVEVQYTGNELKMIVVFDGTTIYMYDPLTDTYMKQLIDETELEGKLSLLFATDLVAMAKEALNDPELKETGKEELNGIKTRVIEFNHLGPFGKEKTKTWISEEYGVPIKYESIVTGTENKLVVEIKNIKVNSVQDSTFEIPEDKLTKIIKDTELTETEEKLCVIEGQNIVLVEKCVLNEVILYSKEQDNTMITDTGSTTFFDETGTKICSYAWFSMDREKACTQKLTEWNPEFIKEDCDWIKLCHTEIKPKT